MSPSPSPNPRAVTALVARGLVALAPALLAASLGLASPPRASAQTQPAAPSSTVPAAASAPKPLPPLQPTPPRFSYPSPNHQQPTVTWNPAWRRFHPVQYATTAALIAADVAIVQFIKDPEGEYSGGILFDDAVLGWLVMPTPETREQAQHVSNRFHEATFLFGMIEPAFTAGVIHGNWDAALQMSLISAQSFGAAGFVQLLSARLIGRNRPYVSRCAPDEQGFPCQEGGGTLSFSSGHVMTSYVAAGLVCAHHSRLPLWGGHTKDAAACALTLASGTMTGLLRVMAEKHYPTDVALGMILGFGFGYGLPMLLHYNGPEAETLNKKTSFSKPVFMAPIPYATADRIGVTWGAFF